MYIEVDGEYLLQEYPGKAWEHDADPCYSSPLLFLVWGWGRGG